MIHRLRLLAPVLPAVLAAGLLPQPGAAEVRALLVGVSDYHVLDADLRGPMNDVGLMADMLIARGADPAMIRVLAAPGARLGAGIVAPEDPTRAAILGGLDALAAVAGPDDTVIFYFSGHGSQAPDQNGDESGGYDEILLPSDAAGWKGAVGAVENAIIDDELQGRMQAILDTGAELVAILDACHSATGFRAAGGPGVARYVAPHALGIPDDAASAAGGPAAPPLTGRFAFLYSSQSDERSFEYPLGDPADPANWYGDFTRHLAAVLTEVPDLTWAQALGAASDALTQGQSRQTPDGEGTALDTAVFGAGSAAGARFRVVDGQVMAGQLAGLAEGAEVELFDRAAGGTSLGRVILRDVAAADAGLKDAPALPSTAYAELRSPGRPPEVLIGPVVASADADTAVLQVLGHIRDAGLIDGAEWRDEDFDIRLVLDGPDIAVVGRDGQLDAEGPGTSPRIPALSGEDVILGFIDRAVQVARLRAVLARAEGRRSGLTLPGAGVSLRAERLAGAAAAGDCGEALAEPVALADGGAVAGCDQVWLAVRNGSTTAQDVTVLYIGRDLTVTPIWPPEGQSNRVAFGETAEIGMRIENPDNAAGAEEIVVIAVPAREGAMRTVLTGLAGLGYRRATGGLSPMAAYLTAAADPDASRAPSFPGRPEPVKVIRLRVVLTPAIPN